MVRLLRQQRLWTVVLPALLILAVGAASFYRQVDATRPSLGVEWAQSPAGPVVAQVEPAGPAARAGLREGDRLRAAGGRPVPSALDANQLAWHCDPGRPIKLSVQGSSGVERELALEPDWVRQEEPYSYLALVGLAFWVSGLFIALRWPDIRGGKIYAALAASLFVTLTYKATGTADTLDWVIEWSDLLAGSLVPGLLLHFGIAVTKRTLSLRRPVLLLSYALTLGLVLSAIWLSPVGLGGAYRFQRPLQAVELWDRLVFLYLGLSLLGTVTLLAKSSLRSSSSLHRGQMRWLLWGLASGLGPFMLFYALPWALGADALPAWAQFLAVAPMLLVPAACTAALARYRLQDLDLLLLRGLTEVAAVFGTFAVLAAAIYLLRQGVSGWLSLSHSATRYVAFLAAAIAYPQLRALTKIGVEKAFYRKRYSYRTTLLDWARELNSETDLTSLLEHLRSRVCQTLDVPAAEVLVRSEELGFQSLQAAAAGGALELNGDLLQQLERNACVPLEEGQLPGLSWARHLFSMKVKGRLRAVLAVAERESPAEPLTTEDRVLLGTLAAHTGTAIEAARLVQEVRHRAEEIERLHARQARILESSAVGLLLLDGEGGILAWNRALEEMYGLGRSEAIGHRLGEVFPLHVARRIQNEGSRSLRPEGTRIFRLSLTNRKEERLHVNIAISPADDAGASDGARVVSFDDVTGLVKLEEQMLQQERLAALGLLAAGVAHEINTPLTGISSYAQLLLEHGQQHDQRREMLEKIDGQARRASRIANSLLDLARPERTTFGLIDLNEAIAEILQLFRPQIQGAGIELQARLEAGLPPILGHKGKLQQVLLNLLLNARDAIGDKGHVRVDTRRRDDVVVLEVSDDGAGISDDDLPRIFDPFFTTKSRGKGTGLGLSISYGIVQEHNGRIQVESSPGEWTRFCVELPSTRLPRMEQTARGVHESLG